MAATRRRYCPDLALAGQFGGAARFPCRGEGGKPVGGKYSGVGTCRASRKQLLGNSGPGALRVGPLTPGRIGQDQPYGGA